MFSCFKKGKRTEISAFQVQKRKVYYKSSLWLTWCGWIRERKSKLQILMSHLLTVLSSALIDYWGSDQFSFSLKKNENRKPCKFNSTQLNSTQHTDGHLGDGFSCFLWFSDHLRDCFNERKEEGVSEKDEY